MFQNLKNKIKTLWGKIKNAVQKNYKKILSYVITFFVGVVGAGLCRNNLQNNRNTTDRNRNNSAGTKNANSKLAESIDTTVNGIQQSNSDIANTIKNIRKQKLQSKD